MVVARSAISNKQGITFLPLGDFIQLCCVGLWYQETVTCLSHECPMYKKTRYKPHKLRRLKMEVTCGVLFYFPHGSQLSVLYLYISFLSSNLDKQNFSGSIGPKGHPLSQQISFHKIPYLNVLLLY